VPAAGHRGPEGRCQGAGVALTEMVVGAGLIRPHRILSTMPQTAVFSVALVPSFLEAARRGMVDGLT